MVKEISLFLKKQLLLIQQNFDPYDLGLLSQRFRIFAESQIYSS